MFRALFIAIFGLLVLELALHLPSVPISLNTKPAVNPEKDNQDINSLEGTWRLMAAKLAHTIEGEPDEFTSDAGAIALKIFTRNRFVVLRYDKETHTLLGTGGGTYIQLGDHFTEYIDYHSWDSTLIDHPQTFTCAFEGDLFTQEGVIRGGNTDGQALEEVYQRVENPFSYRTDLNALVGSWRLEKWANGDVEKPVPPPSGVHGFKIFTPEYFYALRYRDSGGISSFAFGTYELTQEYLKETIISLGDLSAVGQSYTFNWNVEGNQFLQKGFIDSDQFMGYKIEEYYVRE